MQDRYDPILERSDRFNTPQDRELVSHKDQADTRDGQDHSGNLSCSAELGDIVCLALDGLQVKTDRELMKVSRKVEFDDGETIVADVPGLGQVDQENRSLGLAVQIEMAGGTTGLDVNPARFEDDSVKREQAIASVDRTSATSSRRRCRAGTVTTTSAATRSPTPRPRTASTWASNAAPAATASSASTCSTETSTT